MKWKELLGAELAEKVTAALKGKGEGGKDIELDVVNDGSYIAADKYVELEGKLKAADELAKTNQATLDTLKKVGDPAKLKEDLEAALKKIDEDAAAHTKAMADKDLHFAVRSKIADAHDPDLVAGMLDTGTMELLKDGTVKGLDDQLKGLREGKSFLFKPAEEQAKQMDGLVPAAGGAKDTGDQSPAGPTIF